MENRSWVVFGFLGLLGMAVSAGCVRPFAPVPPAPTPLPSAGCQAFQSVTVPDQDFNSDPHFAIRSQADWNAYLATAVNPPVPPPPAPANLQNDMVLVFSQNYNDACTDSVTFTSVCYFNDRVEVTYDFRLRGFDNMCNPLVCAQAYGTPYTRAVTAPSSSLPVSWIRNDVGCSGWPTPTPTLTLTSTPTATPTPTETPVPIATATPTGTGVTGILWNGALCSAVSGSVSISMGLSVNGFPETTAGVTFEGPGLSVPLQYITNINGFAFYVGIQPAILVGGQDYRLATVTSVGTASVTLTAPGMPSIAVDGSQVSWSPEGNADRLRVARYFAPYGVTFDSLPAFPDINSVFNVPLATAYPSPGDYWVTATTRQVTNTVPGADPPSSFEIDCYQPRLVTR